MSVHGFSIPWDELAARAKADLNTVVQKATFDLFSAVVLKTPVGNPDNWKNPPPPGYVGGRFRANWNCTQSKADLSTTGSTDQARAEQQANKALSFAAGDVVYFVNGLPYGPRLEYEGWSSQASSGMVRVSIAEFDQYIKKAIKS